MLGEIRQSTIAAITTPPGYGAIGMIRLSGPEALPILTRLVKPPADGRVEFQPNKATLRFIVNPESGLLIDEAIVVWYKAPHSFTGEDVVEVACHGSPVVLAEILRQFTQLGAELAQPGEFSLRAFLNNRLDLAQAEAINDLIHSQTTYQARVAARQLRGELSRQLDPLKQGIIDLIVHFESAVEFVEDDLDPLDLEVYLTRLDRLIAGIDRLAGSYEIGKVIRSGVKLALVGRPNVGKSSVFNALLGRDRAIVTSLPGTTRDTLDDTTSINGLPISLVDTAGIRETHDPIELLGVERSRSVVTEADFVLAVVEASTALAPEEIGLLAEIPFAILVVNKADLGPPLQLSRLEQLAAGRPIITVSALTGEGLEQLRQTIHEAIVGPAAKLDESAIVTNERHYQALVKALTHLGQARVDLRSGFTEEIALNNLHQALRSLGIVTGETLLGDIINQIFATFCIGK
ncbi:MAG: tRNA uridine-5-carboxymethylaminomethyl(34) synthesis GTPase MnmE [Acidobacteriota bacterium]